MSVRPIIFVYSVYELSLNQQPEKTWEKGHFVERNQEKPGKVGELLYCFPGLRENSGN